MFKEIIDIFAVRSDFFLQLIQQHIYLSSVAIMISLIIGMLVGILISKNTFLAPAIFSITNIMYTFPTIALFGFLIPITGIGDKTAIIALVIYGMLPIIRNVYIGIKNINSSVIEAAVGMGSTPLQVLLLIELPLALPVIFAGFRNMVVMTISIAGIASFIGSGGIGVAIYRGIAMSNATLTLAGSILIAVLAVGVDGILNVVEKYLIGRWNRL
ncbi:MAG: ABC transporter permease [Eubacteriaceae bacterium]|jgi:osmoprotectant transport system permease protein|nr:ABC transporter permease [Eubacteriaceae bacterium]